MYIKREIDPAIIWYFSRQTVLFTFGLSTFVFIVYHIFGYHWVSFPFLPVATIGTAVAFYVGFKNNSAYDRLWEARKIWGELTNVSRAAVAYLLAVIRKKESEETKQSAKTFVYRQIAYVNLLRLQLRRDGVWDGTNLYTQLAAKCFPTRAFAQEGRKYFI